MLRLCYVWISGNRQSSDSDEFPVGTMSCLHDIPQRQHHCYCPLTPLQRALLRPWHSRLLEWEPRDVSFPAEHSDYDSSSGCNIGDHNLPDIDDVVADETTIASTGNDRHGRRQHTIAPTQSPDDNRRNNTTHIFCISNNTTSHL